MQPSLGMQQRTITKGSVITTRINADIDDMINCPKIGKVVKIHDCVLTDCNYEKGHLICTGKSYVHCSFCEAIQPSLKEQMGVRNCLETPDSSLGARFPRLPADATMEDRLMRDEEILKYINGDLK